MQKHILIILFVAICLSVFGQTNSNSAINLGPGVNTKFEEGHPMLSADGKELYFWRDLFRNDANEKIQNLWYAKQSDNGTWLAAKYLPEPFNIKNKTGSVAYISPDNNTIVIKGYFKNGARTGPGFSYINRGLDGFKNPIGIDVKNLNELNKGKYSGACFLPDSKGMIHYFSETDDSKSSDLYYSFKNEDGSFSEPQYIKELNTQYDDSTPFVASDNRTLYFSSNRKGTIGDQDIWKTTRLDDTWQKWSEPVNMGPSINTEKWDAYFTLDAKAEYAYMSIDGDIVKILLNEKLKPQPVVLIKGKVFDKLTKQPLQAKVYYENLKNGKNEGFAISDPTTGSYQIALPYGTNYGFNALSNSYLPISDNIDLTQFSAYKEITRDLYLVPELVGQVVRINNVFFEFGKSNLQTESFPELNRLAIYLKQKPNIKIEMGGHTDNIGKDEANFKLSADRAKSVQLYLVNKGVSENRISYKGYGKTLPIASNDTDEGRALNRRVEFTIIEL